MDFGSAMVIRSGKGQKKTQKRSQSSIRKRLRIPRSGITESSNSPTAAITTLMALVPVMVATAAVLQGIKACYGDTDSVLGAIPKKSRPKRAESPLRFSLEERRKLK